MSHKGHAECPHNSKAACDKARRIAIGQCSSMIDETRQCPHWGIDRVDDKPYCGQHLNGVFLAADKSKRETARRDEMHARIDAYLARTFQVGHTCGDQCQFSQIPTTSGGTARSESISPPGLPLF